MPEARITYRTKKSTICPVCKEEFRREELHTGGGRMNAGILTDELHREYLQTKKYGTIYPLIYPVAVCPRCWFAAFPRHFTPLEDDVVEALERTIGERKNIIRPLFDNVDFERERTLNEGIAANVLAAASYDHFPRSVTPTFLRGLCFLRAGWLAKDLHEQQPSVHYDYMARIFLRKASFFYAEVLQCQENGSESIEEIPHHGPDLDNNYGYDGVLYLVGVLQLKYGRRDNPVKRAATLQLARTAVSRIVGMGESSKAKPSALLDLGRDLHKAIKTELKAIEGGP